MLHAREDYNRIQDPEGKIGEDEPVILFRASDKHMIGVMADYLARLWAEATCDPAIIAAVQIHIFRTRAWQKQHPPKDPDMNVADIVNRNKLKN